MAFTVVPIAVGPTMSSADYEGSLGGIIENAILSGFLVTQNSGLVVNIAAGTAFVEGHSVTESGTTFTLPANSNSNLWLVLVRNGASKVTGANYVTQNSAPADSVQLASFITSGTQLTSPPTDKRQGQFQIGTLSHQNVTVETQDNRNVANGYSGLDVNGHIPSTNLAESQIVKTFYLFGSCATNLTCFVSLASGLGLGSTSSPTTESNAQSIIGRAGTFKNLRVQIASSFSGTVTIVSRINGVSGNLTISITTSGAIFTDVAHSDVVAINNLFDFQVSGGTGSTSYPILITVDFVPS